MFCPLFTWILQMKSFLSNVFVLPWPGIEAIISGPVVTFSICASCCARGGVRPSVNIGIFTELWRLETFLPTVIHLTSDHVNTATGVLGTNTGILCHHENTSDESFIFMLRVQELWNIWNSSDWLLLSLYITGNFPRLPRVRSDCQVQGSHLTPHDRSFQTKVPWFYWVFFHCPRIFVQFQFLLTAKLTTNRLL